MEQMPFQPPLRRAEAGATPPVAGAIAHWLQGLPQMACGRVTLRELRKEDAPSLLAMLGTEEVVRFISPPPSTVEGFARFIGWAVRERQNGTGACFAVLPEGQTSAVGLFQLRSLVPDFSTAEWGFAIGSAFWGSGAFLDGARGVLDFATDIVGVHRLEARAAVANGRGNGALRKLGAVQEGVLRRSFLRNGAYHDQVLWSILAEDWRALRLGRTVRLH